MTDPDDGTFNISFGAGQSVDLDELRRRKEAVMPDGGHAWSISAIYGIDDPEQALDSMELTAENFVGVGGLRCLLCNTPYRTGIRHYKCSQTVDGRTGG